MNWTLIKKDLRLMRTAVVVAVLATVLIHAITYVGMVWDSHNNQRPLLARDVGSAFILICVFNLWCSAVFSAVLGGLAFAAERQDHSADWISMLPIHRAKMVQMKLISTGSVAVAVVTVQLGLLIAGVWLSPNYNWTARPDLGVYSQPVDGPATVAVLLAVATYGIAWLMSSICTGTTLPVVISTVTVIVTMFAAGNIAGSAGLRNIDNVIVVTSICLAIFGLISVPLGSFVQCHRPTP